MKQRTLWLSRLLFLVLTIPLMLFVCGHRPTPSDILLSRFDVENVEVLQAIPVADGTDGLLGVVQYSRDGSGQFLCTFVTETGCYTCWLPSDWLCKEGTGLTWLGDNTVAYTTANQGTQLPAVRWTFTYGKTDDQPRITAQWEAVREPHISAFLWQNPLLKFYSPTLFFSENYPFYQWNLLPAEQYTVPSEDGGHLQVWEVGLQGILAWLDLPDGQTSPTADNVRQTAFSCLWRQNFDQPLTLYQFDDTLDPVSLAEAYQSQENIDVNAILQELPQMVLEEWAFSQ